MNPLILPLAEQLLTGNAIGGGSSFDAEKVMKYTLTIIIGVLFMAGIVLTLYGSHLWFVEQYGVNTALLMTGVSCFGTALIIAGIIFCISLYNKMKMKIIKQEVTNMVTDVLDTLEQEIAQPVQENPKAAMLIASLVGYTVAKRVL